MTLVWTLLSKFWPEIFIGLIVIAILGYIGILRAERNHYKSELSKVTLAYNKAVKDSNDREASFKLANAALTEQFAKSQSDYKDELDKNNKLIAEKIKNDKELASLRISLANVRLFNESANQGRTVNKDIATAFPGHDETSNPAPAAAAAVTGTELFAKIDENNKNHWACVNQVNEWIKFWNGFESNVAALEKGQ